MMWGVADGGSLRSILTSFSSNAETQQLWIPREVAARMRFSAAAEESCRAYFTAASLYWDSKSVLVEQTTTIRGAWAIQD